MAFLPDHVKMMRRWLDLVEEIVVVDSSGDDTLEFLKKEFSGLNVRFFQHPTGLYQSWNYGISQVRSRYVYISTAGDSITRTGLENLVEMAEKHACDVMVSPPDLLHEERIPIEGVKWPVHNIINFMDAKEPVCFEGFPLFLLAVSFLPLSILGSSASNVYRTATLQKHPFRANFGTMGDCAWGTDNAFSIRLGITPMRASVYIHHRKTYPLSEYEVENITVKLLENAIAGLDRASDEFPHVKEFAQELDLANGIRSKIVLDRCRIQLMKDRMGAIPWFMKPAAWRARSIRNIAEKQCLHVLSKTEQCNGLDGPVAQCMEHFFQTNA